MLSSDHAALKMNDTLFRSLPREFFFFCVCPFLVWVACAWPFLTGRCPLNIDAISYYQHITFFTDNIIRGTYPLWDPDWVGGSPYNFFLRRIGEINPFYWLIGGLKLAGLSQLYAYLIFLAAYYFIAMAGFWLLARLVLKDRLISTGAYLLLLFSWWPRLFCSYEIILFVPLVWFFYFLLSFADEGKKHQFLGIFFTLGMFITTYIPFFSITIVGVFLILALVFFKKDVMACFERLLSFSRHNRILASGCMIFFLLACVPAVDFYLESRRHDFVMPARHLDSTNRSQLATTGLIQWDIISHGYFDKVFASHDRLFLWDFFIPYFFFIALAVTFINPVKRNALFLLANILVILLLGIKKTPFLQEFFFTHIFFFQYMRMLHFFFWLAVLPIAILLIMGQLKDLLYRYRQAPDHRVWLFIAALHLIFGGWLLTRPGLAWSSYMALGFSFLFFQGILIKKWPPQLLLVILLPLIMIQPVEISRYIAHNSLKAAAIQTDSKPMERRFLLRKELVFNTPQQQKDDDLREFQQKPYYAGRWFSEIRIKIPGNLLANFTSNKLYLMDNVEFYSETSSKFFNKLAKTWGSHRNLVFLPAEAALKEDWSLLRSTSVFAQPIGENSRAVKVTSFDGNSLHLRTDLPRAKFLVWTDAYHPGWRVLIDGHETVLFRADHAFKGVLIPPGQHSVIFRFATPLRYAAAYGLMSVFILALGSIIFLARKERLSSGEGAVRESQ